jgi:hypothetical protein
MTLNERLTLSGKRSLNKTIYLSVPVMRHVQCHTLAKSKQFLTVAFTSAPREQ